MTQVTRIRTFRELDRTPSSKPKRQTERQWPARLGVAVAILACIAGVLAISQFVLIHQSIRLDESQILWQASHSVPGLLRTVGGDVHVPLYHMILHFWLLYVGTDIESVRTLSLLFFIVSIPAMYLLSRHILSRRWALFATALFSFSPFMNWYGNEARMYTLLVLLIILTQYFFLKIMKQNKGWLGFTICAMLGIYAHYFFMFNLAAIGVFYLWNYRKFAKRTFIKFCGILVLLIVEFLPWFLYFRSLGSAGNTSPMLPKPSSVDFFNAFSHFIFGFQTDRINTILMSCWPLLVVVGFFAIRRNQRPIPSVTFLAIMAFLPVVAAYIISVFVHPFFLSRYMISAVPALILLIIWLISRYPRALATTAAVGIIAIVGMTSWQQYMSADTPVKEDYKGVAQLINREVRPQDIVVVSAPFTIYPFQYYYRGDAQIVTLPLWDRQQPGAMPSFSKETLPKEVNQIIDSHRNLYLILSQDQGYEEDIRQYFEGHFTRLQKKQFSPDLTLYVYKVGYKQPQQVF